MRQRSEDSMQAATTRLLAIILVTCTAGCRHVLVTTPAFSPGSGVRLIDPNDGPFVITSPSPTDPDTAQSPFTRSVMWKPIRITTAPDGGPTYEVKADGVRFTLSSKVYVPVTMPGGRKYLAVMDTGFSHYLYVNDAVVRECDLAVCTFDKNRTTGYPWGVCEIPSLTLGQTVIETLPCLYEHRYRQLRLLGIPVHTPKTILLGLRFMRAHAYVHFDSRGRTVRFSLREAFEPEDASAWVCLPFAFKEIGDNLRMLADLPLGGRVVQVEFDTGGAKPGLSLKAAAWEQIRHQLDARDAGHGHYRNLQFGRLPCHRYAVPTLSIGAMNVRNARINVVPQDDPVMQGFDGVLSLNYFRRTAVVLDFRKNLIWVRKP